MENNPIDERVTLETRRQLFGRTATGLGTAALASLLNQTASAESTSVAGGSVGGGALGQGHFPAKAKRVIWLFMAGAPSHLDTLDHKPQLDKWFDTDLPESVRKRTAAHNDDRVAVAISHRSDDVSF
jgi:hypothetical protein